MKNHTLPHLSMLFFFKHFSKDNYLMIFQLLWYKWGSSVENSEYDRVLFVTIVWRMSTETFGTFMHKFAGIPELTFAPVITPSGTKTFFEYSSLYTKCFSWSDPLSISVRKKLFRERIDDGFVWGSHIQQPKLHVDFAPRSWGGACLRRRYCSS